MWLARLLVDLDAAAAAADAGGGYVKVTTEPKHKRGH